MHHINKALQILFREYWEDRLKNNPTFATYIGDHRFDDALEDLSEETIAAHHAYLKNLLSRVENEKTYLLSMEERLNLELFKNLIKNDIRMYDYKTHYLLLDQLSGPHIDFPQITEYHPFSNLKDMDNYIARLHAFPRLIDQVIDNLQKGLSQKITAFKKSMETTISQVETFAKLGIEDHPLFLPVLKLSEEFSKREKETIKNNIISAISYYVTPAYLKLLDYLRKEYIQYCREKEGFWALPNGLDMYMFFVKYHTTTELTPEEIHELGKSEVKGIGRDIKMLMRKIGFSGGIREFADYVRGRNDLYPKSGKEVLDGYREILREMDKKLPDFFGRLPKAGYGLKEIEKYREQAAPAAYYYPPPRDSSRPGYYYANTYQPERRPKFVMEALSYHEAVPGHHIQIAIMQEQENIPEFRRYEGSTAFIEGWALYAEKLAKEMGFYNDNFSEYGRLTYAMWRAVRLVVDTGIHYFRWSRDECIKYFKDHTGLEAHEIEVEVDRYIVRPGQALSYKIGELKILELREKAKKVFGSEFDIKEFHDRLLENGALPLCTLEMVMNRWMNKRHA